MENCRNRRGAHKKEVPTFSTILLFPSFPSAIASFSTFIHAHKCTPKTLFITSNKDQRHEHVLIQSRTSFTKACDSADCFGRRESIASFRQSSIREERTLQASRSNCSRAASKAERERTTNENDWKESTGYERFRSRMRCSALEVERAEGSRKT